MTRSRGAVFAPRCTCIRRMLCTHAPLQSLLAALPRAGTDALAPPALPAMSRHVKHRLKPTHRWPRVPAPGEVQLLLLLLLLLLSPPR